MMSHDQIRAARALAMPVYGHDRNGNRVSGIIVGGVGSVVSIQYRGRIVMAHANDLRVRGVSEPPREPPPKRVSARKPSNLHNPASSTEPYDVCVAVCMILGVTWADFVGRSRNDRHILARELATYVCRKRTRAVFCQIARVMGRPNHSTTISQWERAKDRAPDTETCAGSWGDLVRAVVAATSPPVAAAVAGADGETRPASDVSGGIVEAAKKETVS